MKVILCLDNNNGMMFNNRRQSRDRKVIDDIKSLCKDRIYTNSYSATLFDDDAIICGNPLEECNNGYCFIENLALNPYKDKIDEIVVYRWNRDYPSDFKSDINLKEYKLKSSNDFVGYSHEKITREVYTK